MIDRITIKKNPLWLWMGTYLIGDTVKVHCCVLELMSRQILEQITAEELLNTRRFDPKIFISCTKLKGNATYIRIYVLYNYTKLKRYISCVSLKFCTTDV